MSEDQKKLAEDNINLARYMARKWIKKGVRNFDYEDIVSMFSFALCKAARRFDPENGAKFATYAVRCMDNELKMAFRKKSNNGGEVGELHLSAILNEDQDGNELELGALLQSDAHLEYDKVIDTMYAKEAFKILKPRDILILKKKFFEDTTQREIADSLNISQSYVSRLEKKILKRLHDWDKDLIKTQVS